MLQLYYVNKGTVIFSPFNIVNMFPIYEKGIEIALYKAISIPFSYIGNILTILKGLNITVPLFT